MRKSAVQSVGLKRKLMEKQATRKHGIIVQNAKNSYADSILKSITQKVKFDFIN